MKIDAMAGKSLFLDEWIAKNIRIGFARVCVRIDLLKYIYPGTKVVLKGDTIWQQFINENLPNICY